MDTEKKALCVCKGNTCRSPMIEGYLNYKLSVLGNNSVVFESAGLLEVARTAHSANIKSIIAMSKKGINIAAHEPRFISDLDLSKYSLFITVGAEEETALKELIKPAKTPIIVVELDNPYEKDQTAYDLCCNQVFEWVDKSLDAIMQFFN